MTNLKTSAMLLAMSATCLGWACKNPVPQFNLAVLNGVGSLKTADLGKRPAVLVFFTVGCPAQPRFVPLLNALQKNMGNKVRIVGVFGEATDKVKAYAKEQKMAFTVVSDPKGSLVKGFGAKRSLDCTIVATKGENPKFPKIWTGLSESQMAEMLEVIRKHRAPVPKVALKGFPAEPRSGCMLGL